MVIRQLTLENLQAPGDSLMFTCAVRDLHKQYPNEFTTLIKTWAKDIWLNNPYTSNLDHNQKSAQYRIGYSTSINASNQRSAHFATGFVQDLSEKLGLRIKLTDMRPDVHMTEIENTVRPVKDPYWVMLAGGKRDFTTKIWDPRSYQDVVNKLKGKVKFVQAGAANHLHPKLDSVDYRVGKTSLREFMCLIRHAEGVVCPITCAMHLAAAFNKPCVVIAGGREPWWWEAYTRNTWAVNVPHRPCPDDFVDHTYLHTIGKLSCCAQQACWRNGVGEHTNVAKDCKKITVRAGTPQPACMAMITPQIVVESIKRYMDGGGPVLDTLPLKLHPPLFSEPLPTPMKPVMLPVPRIPKVRLPRARRGRGHINRRRFLKPGSPSRPRLPRTTQPDVKLAVVPTPVRIPVVRTPVVKVVSAPKILAACPETDTAALKALATPVTICSVIYGDFPDLARRFMDSIHRTVDPSLFELRLGLNAVSAKTRSVIDKHAIMQGNVRLYVEDTNIFKYPMLRRLFHENPIESKWTIYFDDDSHVVEADWLSRLSQAIQRNPDTGMFGKKYFYHVTQGQIDWYKAAPWYRGKPLLKRKGMPKVDFLTGGYWAIKTEHIKMLDWPDPRLSNNGGDVACGECLHQNDILIKQYYYGIKISDHTRRGASQKHPGR